MQSTLRATQKAFETCDTAATNDVALRLRRKEHRLTLQLTHQENGLSPKTRHCKNARSRRYLRRKKQYNVHHQRS